jgi:hypothetical protein
MEIDLVTSEEYQKLRQEDARKEDKKKANTKEVIK